MIRVQWHEELMHEDLFLDELTLLDASGNPARAIDCHWRRNADLGGGLISLDRLSHQATIRAADGADIQRGDQAQIYDRLYQIVAVDDIDKPLITLHLEPGDPDDD